MDPHEFIKSLEPCLPIVQGRGYFPSVFLAQSILESGWGTSPLTQHNNLWGHKWKEGDDWAFVFKDTPEERAGRTMQEVHRFRVYPSLVAGARAYCDKWEERWKNGNMKYNPDFAGPQAFVESIAATYATDSRYAEKLKALIYEWDLEQYDGRRDDE